MSVFQDLEDAYKAKYKGWGGVQQFEGTAGRLERMFGEMCWTPKKVEEELSRCFSAVFDDSYNEMLVSGPTEVWTLCPHHLVPCHFSVYIGYIPKDKVLGLSKFSRVALILGKRPIMQEQYTREVAEAIMENLKPQGCGVWVVGSHGCIMCRGVTQSRVKVNTSVLKGCFFEQAVKGEFFDICRDGREA